MPVAVFRLAKLDAIHVEAERGASDLLPIGGDRQLDEALTASFFTAPIRNSS